ncbi:MAG: hypothetical protein O7B26_05690 [Planctomycetota bacterium]|nr:hypothetical protein [Planctomycetota bacterium]
MAGFRQDLPVMGLAEDRLFFQNALVGVEVRTTRAQVGLHTDRYPTERSEREWQRRNF